MDLPEKPVSDLDAYEDIDIDDEDNPEWTEKDFTRARPAREVLGDALVDAWEKARRDGTLRARAVRDVQLTLAAEVVDYYRTQGSDWERRISDDLEALVRSRQPA